MLAFFIAGLLAAGPAAAVDDGTRPQARVTNGPSCAPGGVVVQVVAGSVPYHVVLATTRKPGGEDSADLRPGQTAALRTGNVDYGETIDSRLEYTALDGSGASYVDELTAFTFTRPAYADCAAITSPAAGVVPSMGALPPLDPDAPPPGDAPPSAGDAAPAVPATSGGAAAPASGAAGGQPMPVQVRTAAETAVAAAEVSPWPPVISALALLVAGGALVAALVTGRNRRPQRS